jgi:uncharacterized protein (TIGR02996 family)
MNFRRDFRAILDKDPIDWDSRLVYADLLEESGDKWDALAQRFMATMKVWPLPPYGANPHWCWPLNKEFYPDNYLGDSLTEFMNPAMSRLPFGSREEAESRLSIVLREICKEHHESLDPDLVLFLKDHMDFDQ